MLDVARRSRGIMYKSVPIFLLYTQIRVVAFYVIASECDRDPMFVFFLSGHDFRGEKEARAFKAAFEASMGLNAEKSPIHIDLTKCGGCSSDPWVLEE